MPRPDTVVPADGLQQPQRGCAFLAVAIGLTMAVLDGAVVNVALPGMARELGVAASSAVWVINAYQLAIVVALLPLASLGERIGYRRVFVGGLALFTVGSLACALSGTLPGLVAARALQGLGAAGVMSVNGALLRFIWPQAMLGRGIGWNALVVSAAAAVGPTVASGVLAVATWPWLFAINLPIGVVGVALAARYLPSSELGTRPFDRLGAALNVIVFGLFFVGIDLLGHGGADAPLAAAAIVAALVAGTVLVRQQRRLDAPLIPLDLLAIPPFALSIAGSVCSFAAWALAFIALPFHLQDALGYDQVHTGLLMTPWPVMLGVVAPLAGRLSDRVSAGTLGAIGMAAFGIGMVSLALLPAEAVAFDIVWRTALCGAGFALFQAPNNRTMLSSAPRSRAGAAGGLLASARVVGMTGGATLAALVFELAGDRAGPVAFGIGALLALLAGLTSLARFTRRGSAKAPAGPVGGEARGAGR